MKRNFGSKNGSLRTLVVDSISYFFFNGYNSQEILFQKQYGVATKLLQLEGEVNVLSIFTFFTNSCGKLLQHVWSERITEGFFPHYLTSPEALTELANALHSPHGCNTTTSCQLQHQFFQDCCHCREERRKKKKSTSVGEEETVTFSFLPGEFPPPCLISENFMKNGRIFKNFVLWHPFQRKLFKANSSVYNFRQELIEYCLSDVMLLRKGVSEFTVS